MAQIQKYGLYLLFATMVVANIAFWSQSKTIHARWANVPEPPSPQYAGLMGLGDDEIAYRMTGYFLQNLGNTGGEFQSLADYDYNLLEKWFYVADTLDPVSNYVPHLAAYYFGATEDPAKTRNIVNYLHKHGQLDAPDAWRWFAQAVYKAQYILKDNNLALTLANELAVKKGHVAPWARQLPAFINLKMGRKEAAYGIMLKMLQSERDTLAPQEVNAMLDVICDRTLDKAEAAQNPLCQNRK